MVDDEAGAMDPPCVCGVASVLKLDPAVAQLLVDPLAYLWYVPLREVQRLSQRQASSVLAKRHFTVSAAETSDRDEERGAPTSRTNTPQSFSLLCWGIS